MPIVFVWNSYGDTQVFAGDTKEDVLAIIAEINRVNEVVGEENYDLVKLSKRIDAIGVDEMRKLVNMTVNKIACEVGDDRFDYGSGFHSIIKSV